MPVPSPNFFIGGATASGTSFLTALLLQHTDIYLPPIDREPHFFSLPQRYAKGVGWYHQTWFAPPIRKKAIGERSTTYFHFPEAAQLLRKHFPEAKFIFVLRDPVERCFAQYRYMVLRGIEDLDFEKAIDLEAHRLDKETRHFEYKGRSLYGQQLEHFLSYFPSKQILILSSKKLKEQTARQLQRITQFLQIPPFQSFNTPPLFSSLSVKDKQLQKRARDHFGSAFKYLIEGIRLGTGRDDFSFEPSSHDSEALVRAVKDNLSVRKEKIPEKIKELLFEFFQADQKHFFSITGNAVDFTSWD